MTTINAPVYRTDLQSINPSPVQISSSLLRSETRSKTATVRRVKPVDLFANQTAWGFNSLSRESGLGLVKTLDGKYLIDGPYSYTVGGVFGPDYVGSVDLSFNAIDSRLRKKVKNQNINLAQSVAQYRQVTGMFAQTAQSIFSAFRSLKRGAPIKFIKNMLKDPRTPISKKVASQWLQYQYGWKILISDIHGLSSELNQALANGIILHASTAIHEHYVKSSKVFIPTYAGVETDFGPYRVQTSKYVSRRGKCRYVIRSAAIKQLSQLGITNPALLIWELIPYSFVVDWMIPVGDWLASLDSLAGVESLVVNRGYRITKTNTVRGNQLVEQNIILSRKASSGSLATPRLAYKPSTNLKAVLNGLALLRQLR